MHSRHTSLTYMPAPDQMSPTCPHSKETPSPTPHLHSPRSPKGQHLHQVDLGLSKWADQLPWADMETEAREGKELVQGHAGS